MKTNSTAKAARFAFLFGFAVAIVSAIVFGFTGFFRGPLNISILVVISIVCVHYKDIKPDCDIYDRIVMLVLAVLLSYFSFNLSVMFWTGNYSLQGIFSTIDPSFRFPAPFVSVLAFILTFNFFSKARKKRISE